MSIDWKDQYNKYFNLPKMACEFNTILIKTLLFCAEIENGFFRVFVRLQMTSS